MVWQQIIPEKLLYSAMWHLVVWWIFTCISEESTNHKDARENLKSCKAGEFLLFLYQDGKGPGLWCTLYHLISAFIRFYYKLLKTEAHIRSTPFTIFSPLQLDFFLSRNREAEATASEWSGRDSSEFWRQYYLLTAHLSVKYMMETSNSAAVTGNFAGFP